MRHVDLLVLLSCLSVLACSGPGEQPPPPKTFERTFTFRAISGASMGAIGAAFIAGSGDNHERFDALGGLGAPIDVTYLLDSIERAQLGGFCPLEVLEALAAVDPAALNDPDALDCGGPVAPRFAFEHAQHFNHWKYTDNGGSFDRGSYMNMFHDLSLALGNAFYDNPESPFYPAPGVEGFACGSPVAIEGLVNAEYNPLGEYPVVPFCDGDPTPVYYCDDVEKTPYDYCSPLSPGAFCSARGAPVRAAGPGSNQNPDLYYARMGRYDPCYNHRRPVTFALAVDINRNGRRDYHEPIIRNGRERFLDVGVDGCTDEFEDGLGGCTAAAQTGDPNGDNYDPYSNPSGAERNGRWDDGEPFEDHGLDGVPGTGDFGEDNGVYDDSPNRTNFFAHDFRTRYLQMTPEERASIDVWIDGGIRDVFNLGLSGAHLFSAMTLMQPADSRTYFEFLEMPARLGSWQDGIFDPLEVDYRALGRNVFLRYGSETPSLAQLRAGDGDHVGTVQQVALRFAIFAKWVSERWSVALGEPRPGTGEGRRINETYFSEVLGAPRNFSIALPPGYDENTDRQYPVLLMQHGYGMEPGDMVHMNIVFDAFMTSGQIHDMIIVYPSGRCCYNNAGTGERDCRESDDDGRRFDGRPGWARECVRGNFFVNAVGDGSRPGSRYGDAVLELLEHVAANYRTLPSMTVEVPLEEG